MHRVRCNNCMKEFDEHKIIYDGKTDTEYCPYCGEGGCLMDLEDKTLYELASDELNENPYDNTIHKDLIKMFVSEHDDSLDEIAFYVEKEWLTNYANKNFGAYDFNEWIEGEYTSEESEPILFDGIRAGVVAGVYKA